MPPIVNAQGIGKAFGAAPLFQGVSFTIEERDRSGLIGPNGSGKSTLLRILAGRIDPDGGDVARRKLTRLSYVAQESTFEAGLSIRAVLLRALAQSAVPENEREGMLAETLGRAGFDAFDAGTLAAPRLHPYAHSDAKVYSLAFSRLVVRHYRARHDDSCRCSWR